MTQLNIVARNLFTIAVVLFSFGSFYGQTPPTKVPSRSKPATTRRPPKPSTEPALKPKWPEVMAVPGVGSTSSGGKGDASSSEIATDRFNKGVDMFGQRKTEEALAMFREAEKAAPDRFNIQYMLGVTNAALSKLEPAISSFRRAIALDPKSPLGYSALCKVLDENGRRLEAIAECRKAVELAPDSAMYRGQLARLYMLDERSSDALALLQEAFQRSQNDIMVLGNYADALFYEGEYLRASEIYEQIKTKWPQVSVTYLRLSAVYDYLDRPTESISAAKKYAEIEPRNAFAFLNLGNKMIEAGFFDESIEPLKKAIELDQNYGTAHMQLSSSYQVIGDKENALNSLRQAYRNLPPEFRLAQEFGTALIDYGLMAEAIEPLERANSMMADNPYLLRQLGLANFESNNFDKALDLLMRSDALKPNDPTTAMFLNVTRTRKSMVDRLDEILDGVKKEPTHAGWRNTLGAAYRYKGMYKEAEVEYLESIRLKPDDYFPYNEISIFYHDTGRIDKQLEYLRKAAQIKPHHVLYLGIGVAAAKLGRLDEAIEAFKRSIEIKPAFIESHLELGDALQKKGLRENARQSFQTAFDLASGDPRPNFKLAWLYIRMGNKDGAWRHFDILKGIVPNEVENLELCIIAHFGPRR